MFHCSARRRSATHSILVIMMAGIGLFLTGCSRERQDSSTKEVPGFSVVQDSMTDGVSKEAADFEMASQELFSRVATCEYERYKLAEIPQFGFQSLTHP
jgi:hypothetical protein